MEYKNWQDEQCDLPDWTEDPSILFEREARRNLSEVRRLMVNPNISPEKFVQLQLMAMDLNKIIARNQITRRIDEIESFIRNAR